jgi:hypothetical protein
MKLWQRWRQTAVHNKALVWTSFLVAFGTIFYSVVAVRQYYFMKQNALDSAAQVDRLVRVINLSIQRSIAESNGAIQEALQQNRASLDDSIAQEKASIDAAAKQNKAALDASISQASNTLRPYLYVARMTMLGTFADGQRFKGQGEIINAGRTPAVHAMVCADITLRPRGNPLPDGFPCPAPGNPPELQGTINSEAIIGPNAPPVTVQTRGTTITPIHAPATLLQLVTSHDFMLYFYGDLTYAELLNQTVSHRTEFCGIYNVATKHFDTCEHHNNAN